MGPYLACSAVANAPSLPSVGTPVLVVEEFETHEDVGTDEALGDGDADGLGDGLAAADPLGDGEADAPGDELAPGDPLAEGDADADGLGDGSSRRPISIVRMSTYWHWVPVEPVELVMATVESGSPCAMRTSFTPAGSGVAFAKWTSQIVPPVKSIEGCRPSLPPGTKVSRMKMKPGTVIARLKR